MKPLADRLVELLKLRRSATTDQLTEEHATRLRELESSIAACNALLVVDTLTRPGFASGIWHLIR